MTKYLAVFLIFFVASCVEPGPPPVPPEAEYLAPIVAELQLAEALTSEVPVLIRDSMREVFFDRTLTDHQLTRESFDSLLWLVRAEPAWIDSLYSRVGVILSKQEAERE